jgi:HAD superfamily hydrolase (TIGR01509 family)
MRYEAILFDFDGVLVDSEPVHFECWREIVKPFGLELDWPTYRDQGIGVSDRQLLSLLCRQLTPPLDVELLVAEYPRKKNLFRSRMLETRPFSADVLDLIAKLANHRLGVVTSSGRTEVEPVLAAAGIRDAFEVAVYGGDVRRLKPAPDPYLLAVERLGVSAALVVEDSDSGEASARAAGLDVLRIRHQHEMAALVRERLGL